MERREANGAEAHFAQYSTGRTSFPCTCLMGDNSSAARFANIIIIINLGNKKRGPRDGEAETNCSIPRTYECMSISLNAIPPTFCQHRQDKRSRFRQTHSGQTQGVFLHLIIVFSFYNYNRFLVHPAPPLPQFPANHCFSSSLTPLHPMMIIIT